MSRINPQAGSFFSSLATVDDGGTSSYNAMLATLNYWLTKNFSVLANTWSHCINEHGIQSEISGGYYQDPHNRAGDRGNCVTDQRSILNGSFLANSPHFAGSWAKRLLRDWNLGAIVIIHTGFWLSPAPGTDASLTGVGADRPNVIGPITVPNPTMREWFNTAAYSKNLPGAYGNAGRDTILGPGGWNTNLAVSRSFPFQAFDKTQSIYLRIEAFNALNHPNFQNPDTTWNSQAFGRILNANSLRELQLAIKYVF